MYSTTIHWDEEDWGGTGLRENQRFCFEHSTFVMLIRHLCGKRDTGVSNILASLGHTGRRVVLSQSLNTLWYVIIKKSHNVLSKFTILCWATVIAILCRMQPMDWGLDTPARYKGWKQGKRQEFGSYQNIEMRLQLPFLAILYVRYPDNKFLLQNTSKYWIKDSKFPFKYIAELKRNQVKSPRAKTKSWA